MTTSCLLTAQSSHACMHSTTLILFLADKFSNLLTQVWLSSLPRSVVIENTAVHSHESCTFLWAVESLSTILSPSIFSPKHHYCLYT
jgi:hypothetical protein